MHYSHKQRIRTPTNSIYYNQLDMAGVGKSLVERLAARRAEGAASRLGAAVLAKGGSTGGAVHELHLHANRRHGRFKCSVLRILIVITAYTSSSTQWSSWRLHAKFAWLMPS